MLSVNPRLLVIVGGTEYQGDLTGVAEDPVRLRVRAPPGLRAARLPLVPLHRGADRLRRVPARSSTRAGATARREGIAPLDLSEFGTCTNPSPREQCDPLDPAYLDFITRYLRETDMEWAYWPLNGTQSAGYGREHGAIEAYGLLNGDWSAFGNQTVLSALQSVQRPRLRP